MRSPNFVAWHVILENIALPTYCIKRSGGWWYDGLLGIGDSQALASLSGLEIPFAWHLQT